MAGCLWGCGETEALGLFPSDSVQPLLDVCTSAQTPQEQCCSGFVLSFGSHTVAKALPGTGKWVCSCKHQAKVICFLFRMHYLLTIPKTSNNTSLVVSRIVKKVVVVLQQGEKEFYVFLIKGPEGD